MSDSISIVVPTYNRLNVLQHTMPSILGQRGVLETVVVDDGSSDGTGAWLQSHSRQESTLKPVCLDRNQGSPAARNAGIRAAAGDWILLVDDDIVLEPDYAFTLLRHAQQHGFDLMAGRRLWLRPGESVDEAETRLAAEAAAPVVDRRRLLVNDCAAARDDAAVPLIQAVMLIRKRVFSEVSYDRRYTGNAWREESDFQLSALAAGYRVGFCPHTRCFHTPKAMAGHTGGQRAGNRLRYEWNVVANNYRFLKKHRALLKRHVPEVRGPVWWNVVHGYLTGRVADKSRRLWEEWAA